MKRNTGNRHEFPQPSGCGQVENHNTLLRIAIPGIENCNVLLHITIPDIDNYNMLLHITIPGIENYNVLLHITSFDELTGSPEGALFL